MIERRLLALAALASIVATPAAAGPLGRWRTADRGGIVEIFACGPALCGRIVGAADLDRNPDLRDARNHDPALRGRRIAGLVLMTGFTGGPRQWSGGSIYRPSDGQTYSGTITLEGEGRLFLKGCVIWPLCRTQTWTRP